MVSLARDDRPGRSRPRALEVRADHRAGVAGDRAAAASVVPVTRTMRRAALAPILIALLGTSAVASSTRPVHPLLPWHRAVVDGRGRLLAWYRPGANLGYDRVLRLGWNFIEHGVPLDRRSGTRVYLAYAVFDGDRQGVHWQHNPAFLYASLVDSLVEWYPYSGDRRAISVVRQM